MGIVAKVVDIPEGCSGDVEIKREVLEKRTMVGSWHRPSWMEAGDVVVRLHEGGKLWMSNTPDEVRSQWFMP